MKKSDKIALFVGAGTLVSVGLAYLIYRKRMKAKEAAPVDDSNTNEQPQATCVVFPLSKGSGIGTRSCAKDQVKTLQQYVNASLPFPYARLTVDGQWGSMTESAVKTVMGKNTVNEAEFTNIESYLNIMNKATV